jgi:large subunit ribosomal protein L13
MKKTQFFNNNEREWLLIDAKDQVLGRLATRIARILQGKDKPTYTPNLLSGNKVVVINARHIRVTGKKREEKIYDKYSGYPGGRKTITLKRLMEKNATAPLAEAVRGMLPKNWIGKRMMRALKIYPEGTHTQTAQKPKAVEV